MTLLFKMLYSSNYLNKTIADENTLSERDILLHKIVKTRTLRLSQERTFPESAFNELHL